MVSSRSPVAFVFTTMTQTVGWAKARARSLSAHEVADTRRAHAELLIQAHEHRVGSVLRCACGTGRVRRPHLCPPYKGYKRIQSSGRYGSAGRLDDESK